VAGLSQRSEFSDGWAIYQMPDPNDPDDVEQFIAVTETEALADTLIVALSAKEEVATHLEHGFKAPDAAGATIVVNVKLEALFDIGLDKGEHLKGQQLALALIDNMIDRLEVGKEHEPMPEWMKHIVGIDIVDAYRDDQGPPPVKVDVLVHRKEATPDKLYLQVVEGDTEPSLSGPYDNDDERLEAARQHKRTRGDRDGLFRLDITKDGTPEIRPFINYELDEDGDDPDPGLWTPEDQLAAQRQGWDIFDCEGSADGRWQLQAIAAPSDHPHLDYDEPKFPGDKEAAAFVREQALKGDPLAKKAIEFLVAVDSRDVQKWNLI
jgi:hypothetical protein